MKAREFNLDVVLSIATRTLLCPFDDLFGILNFLTGAKLQDFQIGRAADDCIPYLLEQFPWLKEVDVSGVNEENFEQWFAEQTVKYGKTLTLKPAPNGTHKAQDVVTEAIERKGGDLSKITTIVPG